MPQSQTVSIIITSYNDKRIFGLVEHLTEFNVNEIIIADGGSSRELVDQMKQLCNEKIIFYNLPGNIAETRYQVQSLIKGDLSVFIDTDEIPTEGWIERLIEPILNGEADFTFGSTKPFYEADNRFSKYLDKYDEYLYKYVLPVDILKGAMGNSAWKTEIVNGIGFDPCLGIGGEDYDLTIRAVKKGYKGKYVKDAVLLHNQNSIKTWRKFIKKMFYNYQVGASLAYRKSGMLMQRASSSAVTNVKFRDPMEIVIFMLKIPAVLFSLIINPWNDERYCDPKFQSLKKED